MAKKTDNHGFTLVEVIVTAVIVVILSAVAIPSYRGYLRSAQQSAVNNLATTAAATANANYRKTATALTTATIGNLGLFYDATKYTITVSNNNIVVTPIGAMSGVTAGTVAYK
jgi:prepilin-type N-terminal cleavage/methylation domain-containing protein